jgi:hypothetical protein
MIIILNRNFETIDYSIFSLERNSMFENDKTFNLYGIGISDKSNDYGDIKINDIILNNAEEDNYLF